MNAGVVLHLTRAFLRIFLRDRQAMFFGMLFPVVLLSAFGFVENRAPDPVDIGVVDLADNDLSARFIEALSANTMFRLETGTEAAMRDAVRDGDKTLVVTIPASFSREVQGAELAVLVNAEELRSLGFVLPLLESTLVDIERELRGAEAMFTIAVEDVDARTIRYLDFLLPGILAFTLMQISIAGSGFNLVEYRRKGILKRLFVTPVRPADFIAAISLARMVFCMVQLTVVVLFAMFILDVEIAGNVFALLFVVAFGIMIFLCLGFGLGSLATTQQSIGALGSLVSFPQIVLSGVFFPIDMMPGFIQPFAHLLPLSSVVGAMRDISSDGASLLGVAPYLGGMLVWLIALFLLASRLFSWQRVAA